MKRIYTKQYTTNPSIGRVVCRKSKGSKWLRDHKVYHVIDHTETQFLIRFPRGGAKWYGKNRFEIYKVVAEKLTKPKQSFKVTASQFKNPIQLQISFV